MEIFEIFQHMKITNLKDWLKLLSSAGFITFIWFLIQRFININHDRKSSYYKLLLKEIFLPFQKTLELHLFRFPMNDDIDSLSNYIIMLNDFINTIETNEKIFYYIDENLLNSAKKSLKSITKYLTSDKQFFLGYNNAKYCYYKFSEKYWYLLNQTRRFEGVKKRGFRYRLQYNLFSGSKLIFPIHFLEELIDTYLCKLLILYIKICLILFVIGIFCIIFDSL